MANICRASRKDFRDAVVEAREAQDGWSSRSAFNRGQILYRMGEMLESRRQAFVDTLIDTAGYAPDAAGAEYTTPDGAFYVLARFDDFPGTMANVKTLIDEAGVAGMPGATFGTAREEWIRFALVTPRVEAAAERLSDYFG